MYIILSENKSSPWLFDGLSPELPEEIIEFTNEAVKNKNWWLCDD